MLLALAGRLPHAELRVVNYVVSYELSVRNQVVSYKAAFYSKPLTPHSLLLTLTFNS